MISKTLSVSPARKLRSNVGIFLTSLHRRYPMLARNPSPGFFHHAIGSHITLSSINDIPGLKLFSPAIYRGKLIDNQERDVLHCI
jgi:hypothetical protein